MSTKAQKKSTHLIWYGLLIVIVLGVSTKLLMYAFMPEVFSGNNPTNNSTSGNSAYANMGGDFTLTGATGDVSLHDYQGDVVVMMFGFTSCPDVCPTGMASMAAAMNQLTPKQQAQTQGLFISLDPERDTPEKLAQYSAYFHPNITGVTGDTAALDKVVKQYGAFYSKVMLPDSELGYTVDHSARIYLIDKQGHINSLLQHNSPPQAIAEAISALM